LNSELTNVATEKDRISELIRRNSRQAQANAKALHD